MAGATASPFDLIVVGGGPVGLVAAIHARLAGLSVVVLEPRGTPIDKACGEGLMPGAVAELRRLGVAPAGMPIRGITYRQGGHEARAQFQGDPGLGVRRTVLHNALCDRAQELAVVRKVGHAGVVTQASDHVRAGDLRASYLIGADGLHSRVRRSLGLARPARRRHPRRYGIRQHFQLAPWTDAVEVHWGRDAEVYVTPVAPDTVGVAALGPAPLDLERILASVPALSERLRGVRPVGRPMAAGPMRQGSRRRVAGQVLLVGDAAGYVDAITGEGLRLGFREAAAAVASIAAGRPQDYEAAWARITRSYRLLAGGLVWWATRPALRPAIVPAASAMPGLFGAVVGSVGR